MDDRYALRPGIVLHGRYEIKELLGIGEVHMYTRHWIG